MAREKKKARKAAAKEIPVAMRNPSAAQIPTVSKQPSSATSLPSTFDRTPRWKFRRVDHDGQWGFDAVPGPTVTEIIKALASFESMTFHELFHQGDEPGKHYGPESLCKAAQDRLVELRHDDETQISRLRIGSTKRLYGFVRDDAFEILWWDPNHQVCPSTLKHT